MVWKPSNYPNYQQIMTWKITVFKTAENNSLDRSHSTLAKFNNKTERNKI